MSLICRTCMQINEKCVNIFNYHENCKLLSDMLVEFASVKVQENDGLPSYICNCCLEKLTTAWNFRVMIMEADSKLRVFLDKQLKENIQNSNSFINVPIVKEESDIVKSKIFTTLIPENVYKSNSSRPECPLEGITSMSINMHSNFIGNKRKLENSDKMLVKNSNNEDNSVKSIHILTCENDTVISEITSKNSARKGSTTSTCSEADDEVEIPCSLKQSDTSKLLNSMDSGAEKLADRNISRNYVSNENNTIVKIERTKMKSQDEVIYDNSNDNISIVHKNGDDIMLEDNSVYNSDESINNFDISTKNTMEDKLGSEKGNKKLSKKEKARMSVFCKTCNRSFGYRYYFEVHTKHHSGDKKCKCNICGKAFVRQFQLHVHMRVHSDERSFSCETCGKTFKFQSALCSHKTLHSDATPHACSICQKSFKTNSSLKSHFERHKNEKKWTCEVCGKSFSDVSAFYRHKLTHVDGKKFACPTCGKKFSTNLQMRGHLKVHSEARPYMCNNCGKCFKTKTVMAKHSLTHTNEKPYSCRICGKLFKHSASLYNHKRVHTEETPYPCELCPNRFKYSHHLKNHMKAHN